MAKQRFETETREYKREKDYRKDIAKRLNDGWTVQSEHITEHKGGMKWLTFGLLAFMMPKKRKFHVTYVRDNTDVSTFSPKDALKQLEKIHKDRLITDEEYEAKRAEILERV